MAGGLSDADIGRMKKEADQFEQSDKKKQESIKSQETMRSFIYTTESTINNLDQTLKQRFSDRITELQKDLKKLQDSQTGNTDEVLYKQIQQKAKTLLTDTYQAQSSSNKSS